MKHGDIVFTVPGKEMLRLCGNGDIFVRGERVATNAEVVPAFVEWINRCRLKTTMERGATIASGEGAAGSDGGSVTLHSGGD